MSETAVTKKPVLTVWKTELQGADYQQIEVPEGAEFLTAHEQNGGICVWYRCDENAPKVRRGIYLLGTGHDAPDPASTRYVGTAFMQGGLYVFHVFESLP